MKTINLIDLDLHRTSRIENDLRTLQSRRWNSVLQNLVATERSKIASFIC